MSAMSDKSWEETKAELREGDSLRAKFFRWKDRVFTTPLEKLGHIQGSAEWSRARDALMESGSLADIARAKEDLIARPDDRAAYDAATAGVRKLASALKEHGIDARPDEPEE